VRGFLKQFAPDVFHPDEIISLEDAFDDAWRRVEQGKAPWASEEYSAAVLYLSQQKLTRKPPEAL
jgi:hypothetical protein